MALKRTLIAIAFLAAIGASLAYLRDPPWLLSVTSGMRPWEMDADGRRLRWMGGHASLFVPSDARVISIPLRTTFGAGEPSVTATISIDDRPVDRVVMTDPQWRSSNRPVAAERHAARAPHRYPRGPYARRQSWRSRRRDFDQVMARLRAAERSSHGTPRASTAQKIQGEHPDHFGTPKPQIVERHRRPDALPVAHHGFEERD